ncbi:MAG: IS30 family transposase [Coriobacteriales bacterium]|jgi:IS30 family transposase|nr:IS30 family transposase [Coriobacteriales bacterium]
MSQKNYKQLCKEQREQIEEGLNAKKSISEIARQIGVSPATVTREVMRNRRDDGYRANDTRAWGNGNVCVQRRTCDITKLCERCVEPKTKKCSFCKRRNCARLCGAYQEESCPQIATSPHVCNGCAAGPRSCRYHRFRYSAKDAQQVCETRGRETREGIDCTPEELKRAEDILKAGLDNGQGIAHIYSAHSDEIAFSPRSCYRHIQNGDIAILPIELPKAVRYKKRGGKGREKPIEPEKMKGHLYSDFLALDEQFRSRVVECDCVEGPAGSDDAILTMHFKALHFQIGIKLERKDTAHVVKAFDWLHGILEDSFSDVFGIILCDRGSEFKDIEGMEAKDGKRRCAVYFTDAQRPDQKGSCEKNHVELRKIIPKGTSLAGIGAYELAEVFSHVNSERRESLFGLCPLEWAAKALPTELIDGLGYRLVDADDVLLKPRLLEQVRQNRP